MPASGGGRAGNVPAESTSFVGRRGEVAAVRRLLSGSRLVTLTGPGGVGKTRLALRVAAEIRRAFAGGVWLVELGQVQDPSLLVPTVSTTLGMRARSTEHGMDRLRDFVAARHLLLVLDNCEHLVDGCATLTGLLLRGCPHVHILATSRESLNVPAEVRFAVAPLSVPRAGHRPSVAAGEQYEAVGLFVDRAARAQPGFRLTELNCAAVVDICRRLEGLPLAIELATARLGEMQPAEILRRLEHPFQMLTGGGRGAPQRQQTLLASVRWSYDLCTEAERRVWARLATFAGDFELEAAEAVGELAAGQVLDVVTSLVDKSVLMREDHGGTYGFRLLAPVREFGLAKLRESGETTLVYRRHRAYFEQLTMKMRADWVSPRQAVWLARLARGHANLRTVLQFCLDEPGEAPHALAILVSLPYQYWWNRGLIAEGRYWLGRALDLVREPSVLRARALLVGCNLANGQRSFDPGALQEARQLALRFGDRRTLVLVANIAGLEAQWRGDLPAALSEFEQMLSNAAGGVDLHLEIQAYMLLASAHCRRGDLERTRACYEAVVRRAEPRGELFSRHYAAASMGIAAWRHGDLDEAERCFHDMLSCAHRLDNSDSIAWGLDLLAWTAARAGRFPRAATMLGAAGALWDVIGRERLQDPHLYGYHVECGQSVRDALGDTEAEAASRHGRAMTLEDAVRYALGDDRGSATGFRPSPASAVRLTGRERQVADLVAEGLTNRLVAARLVISRRTAESHVENILAKLGFTARAQIAAWAAEHRAGEDSA